MGSIQQPAVPMLHPMPLTSRAALSFAVVAALVSSATPALAATSRQSSAAQADVDLTYDVSVALDVAKGQANGDYSWSPDNPFVPETFSRPGTAPMPASSPVTEAGLKLAPGTTAVVSVFSSHLVNDSACITGTSSRTATVVYLSTSTMRPTLVRPHGCAVAGGKPMVTQPSKAVLAAQLTEVLNGDLKIVEIGEESYATDNEGAYVADVLSRPTKASSPPQSDILVQQGVMIRVGDKVIARTTTTTLPNDGYCLTGIQLKSHAVRYLSSVNGLITSHRPHGCAAG